MLSDLFQFIKYRYRDSNKNDAINQKRDLLIVDLSFNETRRVIRIKKLRLFFKEYYNLYDKDRKRSI